MCTNHPSKSSVFLFLTRHEAVPSAGAKASKPARKPAAKPAPSKTADAADPAGEPDAGDAKPGGTET